MKPIFFFFFLISKIGKITPGKMPQQKLFLIFFEQTRFVSWWDP